MSDSPYPASSELHQRAQSSLPGGNSRHSVFFPPHPLYVVSGEGCRVRDVDGKSRIDCINNMSALIHGHGFAPVTNAIRDQASLLISAGMPTRPEVELAELICERVEAVEQVRFCTSGSESVMFALRAARAYTGRSKIAKAEGAYHGSYDSVEFSLTPLPDAAGPAEAPFSAPATPGLPAGCAEGTVVFPFNDLKSTLAIIDAHRDELAAVLIDPCVSRMGFVMADPGYLEAIRERCTRYGILLVFDEVFSFRIHSGGGQGAFAVQPDLSAFGKVIGGGMPIGAVGGTREHMGVFNQLQSKSLVEHSGTHFANPVSMAAGVAALKALTPTVMAHLDAIGEQMRSGIDEAFARRGVAGHAAGTASLVCSIFDDRPIRNYRDFLRTMAGGGLQQAHALHRAMLANGVQIVPGGGFILSSAMTPADIEEVLEVFDAALGQLAQAA